MIDIGLKTEARRSINVMDEVTNQMSVGNRRNNAREIIGYLGAALEEVGHWERQTILTGGSSERISANFHQAEARALSVTNDGDGYALRCNSGRARVTRSPYALSWIFQRLHEITSNSNATVWIWEVLFDDRRARGRTRVWQRTQDNSGRANSIQVFINSTGSDLDKGFTLLHEICVHAWRLILYGDSRDTAGHFGRSTRHWGAYHVEFDEDGFHNHRNSSHSLADNEADLLQYIREGRPPRRPELGSDANRRHDRLVHSLLNRIMAARRTTLNGQCLSREARVWRIYSPAIVGQAMRICGPQGHRDHN
jgi:hypothetical protein